LRIIRGKLKSRRFSPPKKFPSRPTTDFAKEGIFNILENRFSLQNLEILDLCAGTGNITLEFASREAGKIISVDNNYHCYAFIQKMIIENDLKDDVTVIKADIRDYLRRNEKEFDLIFIDPPYAYESSFYLHLLELIFEKNSLKRNGLLIIEHGKQTNLSNFHSFVEVRNFGNVYFSFFKHQEQ
jgi:16S rRNA (guanine966-N2)-methyltransferase